MAVLEMSESLLRVGSQDRRSILSFSIRHFLQIKKHGMQVDLVARPALALLRQSTVRFLDEMCDHHMDYCRYYYHKVNSA